MMAKPRFLASVALSVVAALAAASRASAQTAAPPIYSLQLGGGYASWSQGLLSLPVLWTAGGGEMTGTFARASDRFVHTFKAGVGRSGAISVDGIVHPGATSTSWVPLDYSFTWLRGGRTFGVPNLGWQIGPVARVLWMTESVAVQGRATLHRDRSVAAGFTGGFRWHDSHGRWAAAVAGLLAGPVPGLSHWAVTADGLPTVEGALFAGQLGLCARVDHTMTGGWTLGASYERDAMLLWRSRATLYSFSEITSFGSSHISRVKANVRYEWRKSR